MALLETSFIGTILYTAQGETEILFNLLADVAAVFPETDVRTFLCSDTLQTSFRYESLHDRNKNVFANASSPSIMRSVSDIIRTSLQNLRFQVVHCEDLHHLSTLLKVMRLFTARDATI